MYLIDISGQTKGKCINAVKAEEQTFLLQSTKKHMFDSMLFDEKQEHIEIYFNQLS